MLYETFGAKTHSPDYSNPEVSNVDFLERGALRRENRLNPEELFAKEEAERECILGPKFWLRAHP